MTEANNMKLLPILKRAGLTIAGFFAGFVIAPVYAVSRLSLFLVKRYYVKKKWTLKNSLVLSAACSLVLLPFVLAASLIAGPWLTASIFQSEKEKSLKARFANLKKTYIDVIKARYCSNIWNRIRSNFILLETKIKSVSDQKELVEAADSFYKVMQKVLTLGKNNTDISVVFNKTIKRILDVIYKKASSFASPVQDFSALKAKKTSYHAICEIVLLRKIELVGIVTDGDITNLKLINKTSPFYPIARFFIGKAAFEKQDDEQALAILQKLPQGSYFYPEAALYLAEIFIKQSAPHKAVACLEAVKLWRYEDKIGTELAFLMGKAYSMLNEYAEANQYLSNVPIDSTKHAEVKTLLIENYLMLRHPDIKEKFDKDSPVLLAEAYRSAYNYRISDNAKEVLKSVSGINFDAQDETSLMLGRIYLCCEIQNYETQIKRKVAEGYPLTEKQTDNSDENNPYASYLNRLDSVKEESPFYYKVKLLKLIKAYIESPGLNTHTEVKKIFENLKFFLLTNAAVPEFLAAIPDKSYSAKLKILLAKDYLVNESNGNFKQAYTCLNKIELTHGVESYAEAQLLLAEIYQKFNRHKEAIEYLKSIPEKSEFYSLAEKMRNFSMGYLTLRNKPKDELDFQQLDRLNEAREYLGNSYFGRKPIAGSIHNKYLETINIAIRNLEVKDREAKPAAKFKNQRLLAEHKQSESNKLYIAYSSKLEAYWNNRNKKSIYAIKDCFFPEDKFSRKNYIEKFKEVLTAKNATAIEAKLREGEEFETGCFSSKYAPEANQYNLAELLIHFRNDLAEVKGHRISFIDNEVIFVDQNNERIKSNSALPK